MDKSHTPPHIEKLQALLETYKPAEVAGFIGVSERSIGNYMAADNATVPHPKTLRMIDETFRKFMSGELKTRLENITNGDQKPKITGDPSRERLERTLENMSEDKIRSTAIMERLVALLESAFNSGVPGKVPRVLPHSDTQGGTPEKVQDLRLGKKYSKRNKPEGKN
jgi:hypothetical protein